MQALTWQRARGYIYNMCTGDMVALFNPMDTTSKEKVKEGTCERLSIFALRREDRRVARRIML